MQLRAKGKLAPEIVSLAQQIEPLCRDFGVPLIINDHPWLVPRCAAAGCHIGQDDGPITAARDESGIRGVDRPIHAQPGPGPRRAR